MKKLVWCSFISISLLNAGSIFGDTEEERTESQKKILGTVGKSVIEIFKNAGKLIVSPVTDKVKEDNQKKQEASENKERADAKKKLLEQMKN
ncbi:hypothetical protein MN086_06305 [Sulfurovum sp. XGS-02]|uniref:hypothetical protein n=1 Tax=Sulfurovum sp. XGS-02 TaxID=2925411 RepID=UPI002058C84A|nr:hypothetical protein [Sulfurovum sp. XGS-02]UPT76665.1 hypothetical protein MN086_06305 [Sulfurovum sp. XGS-02]